MTRLSPGALFLLAIGMILTATAGSGYAQSVRQGAEGPRPSYEIISTPVKRVRVVLSFDVS